MNKIWLLSKSNIRKSRSSAVSLFLIILVAAILLNIGCLTLINYSRSFDQTEKRLNNAHISVVMLKSSYREEYADYFTGYPEVTQVEQEEIICLASANFKFGNGKFTSMTVFRNADFERKLSYLSFIGEQKEAGDTDIYVSYLLHSGGGYELGDPFIVDYLGRKYTFRIAGFTEDIMLGSSNVGCIGFYLPEASYEKFRNGLKDGAGTDGILIQTRLKDASKAPDLLSAFQKNEFASDRENQTANYWSAAIPLVKDIRTSTADIGGAIIVGFSLIIIFISLLVIKFRISTSIEEGMSDIGALKAVGYSSRQINAATQLQFLSIAGGGSLLGIAASYLFLKPLSSMFSAQTGLFWKQGFDMVSGIVSLFLILLSVFIMASLSTRRIKGLHPITALRNGIYTHSFRRNYFPLERTMGNLNLLLAMKSIIINLKQSLMITAIIMAVSFASVFGIVLYYNIVWDDKAFINMLGVEMCSIYATTQPQTDSEALVKEIRDMEGVRKAVNYEYKTVTIGTEDVQVYIMKDFSMLDDNHAYAGRYPEYDNEVIITGFVAEKFHKRVGDTISVHMQQNTVDFLISGFFESSNSFGKGIAVTEEGMRKLQPDYKPQGINIYLEKGVEAELFGKRLADQYPDRIAGTMNMDMMAKSQLDVYKSIVTIFSYVILFITFLVVSMILYLVIKAYIIRRRRDYGIQKAIGYTTLQLMLQTSLSFLPVILSGAVIGSVIGGLSMNYVISTLFHAIGVMNANFFIPTAWIVMLCIGIGIVSYLISMLFSWRIRKISPYALMIEY